MATKFDQGKPQLTYISSELKEGLAAVRVFGARKYGKRNGWKLGFPYSRSLDAAERHITAFMDGEDIDPESGLCHLFHAVASLEHAIYDYKHHKSNDDRDVVDPEEGERLAKRQKTGEEPSKEMPPPADPVPEQNNLLRLSMVASDKHAENIKKMKENNFRSYVIGKTTNFNAT